MLPLLLLLCWANLWWLCAKVPWQRSRLQLDFSLRSEQLRALTKMFAFAMYAKLFIMMQVYTTCDSHIDKITWSRIFRVCMCAKFHFCTVQYVAVLNSRGTMNINNLSNVYPIDYSSEGNTQKMMCSSGFILFTTHGNQLIAFCPFSVWQNYTIFKVLHFLASFNFDELQFHDCLLAIYW